MSKKPRKSAAGKAPRGTAQAKRARPNHAAPENAPGRIAPAGAVLTPAASPESRESGGADYLRHAADRLIVSPGGGVLFIGWVDDRSTPLDRIEIECESWRLALPASGAVRSRRADVEQAVGASGHPFGVSAFAFVEGSLQRPRTVRLTYAFEDGRTHALEVEAAQASDADLRDTSLGHLAALQFAGDPTVETISQLGAGAGEALVSLNRHVTRGLVGRPCVERFGRRAQRKRASLVICLYGKPEFLALQNALMSQCPGIEDYELIFVCNSPELTEPLLRDARTSALVYGLDQTLVLLPGNAGFGAANNAAARFAQSDRLLMVNPDVFPYDLDWARKHSELLGRGAREDTKLFGAPLFYDDGSLMHGGMYFELDPLVAPRDDGFARLSLARVEHYGKGAPRDEARFLKVRPVPAVTGAFISCDRAWFEELGGFAEDFIFGHYEDADLCLRSLARGTPAWIQDLKLWHLEGKGSVRKPQHEGGATVNRWLFGMRWAEKLEDGLTGPNPRHPAFAPSGRTPQATRNGAGARARA